MLALLSAVVVVVESGALHVDKGPDATLPCPANAALEQAVRVRLPQVKLGKGKPLPKDLVAVISGTTGAFRFEVKRPDGSIAMSRDLFSGCAQLGDTSALILERFLAAISWSGRDVGLVPESPKPLAPRPAVPPEAPPLVPTASAPLDAGVAEPDTAALISRIGVAPEPTGNAPISAPAPAADAAPPAPQPPDTGASPVINLPPPVPSPPLVSGLELSLAGGVWYGSPDLVGSFSIDFALMFRERIRVGVLALAGLPVKRDVTRGAMQWFDFEALAVAGACTKGALSLCGHLTGGARFTWATASTQANSVPRLFGIGSGAFAVPQLGLLARLAWAFTEHFFAALDVLGAVNLAIGSVVIEDIARRDTPQFDLMGQGRLGVRF